MQSSGKACSGLLRLGSGKVSYYRVKQSLGLVGYVKVWSHLGSGKAVLRNAMVKYSVVHV